MKDNSDKCYFDKERIFYWFNILLPLLMGTVLYLLFRPDTYISQLLYRIFPWLRKCVLTHSDLFPWMISLCRNFLPDMLWAYSLTFAVNLLWLGQQNVSVKALVVCALFEVSTELAQKVGLLSGTFDRLDIALEICATVLAALVIKTKREKRK